MSNRILGLGLCVALAAASAARADDGKRIRGSVIKTTPDLVTIDAGRDAGTVERMVYDVFVDGRAVRLPLTSEVVYVPQRVIAQLVVVAVDAKTADAKVMPPPGGEATPPKIEKGALVVSNPYTTARNIAPYLANMSAEPARTEFGRPVTVRVTWADDKDDLVTFEWTASGGILSHARSATGEVVWTPPLVKDKGAFKLTVVASDTGGNRATRSIDVEVGPPGGAQKAVYEVRRRLADHTEGFTVARDIAFDEENASYTIDSDAIRVVGRDPVWNVRLRSDEYKQDFKQLDRCVVKGGDLYATDLYAKRAVRLRIGPKMYQDPPAVSYGGEGTGNGQLVAPVDIAVDFRGEVHILDQARGCVQIFAPDGAFIASIGSLGNKRGQLAKAVGMGIATDGTLYVLDDGRKTVLVFRDRRLVNEFEAGAKSETLVDLKVDPLSGRVCVLEGNGAQVRSFSPDGASQGGFGTAGEALAMGTFAYPTRLRFDRLGALYVIASYGKVLHRCDPVAGQEVARWGGIDFRSASDIAAAPNGDLAVLLPKLYVVANLDRTTGWVKGLCGGEGTAPGKLKAPVAVAVDAEGNICVLDQKQGNIQVFRPRGESQRVVGKKGGGPGELEYPIDLATDPARRHLVVLEDRKSHEVKVYDLQAKAGDELRAAFPGLKDGLDDSLRVCMTPSGIVNVAIDGGEMRSFNASTALGGKPPIVEADGASNLGAGTWKIDGAKSSGSLAVSNLVLLFAADPSKGVVQVLDLGRRGALVTTIQDPKQIGEPAVATVDDYDHVYLWDADNGRAVELGR